MWWFELIFKVQNQQKIGIDKIENKIKRKNRMKKILQVTEIRRVIYIYICIYIYNNIIRLFHFAVHQTPSSVRSWLVRRKEKKIFLTFKYLKSSKLLVYKPTYLKVMAGHVMLLMMPSCRPFLSYERTECPLLLGEPRINVPIMRYLK